MIDPRQVVAARGLLDWTQNQLAEAAHIGINTVKVFENNKAKSTPVVILAMQRALEDAGIEFTNKRGKIGVTLKVEN